MMILATMLAASLALGDGMIDELPTAQTIAAQSGGAQTNELTQALALLVRMYSNEMNSAHGRIRWHGKVERQETVTNETGEVVAMKSVYADGYEHTVEASRPNPRNKSAVTAVESMPAYITNGVPARLAAARAKAWQNGKTVTKVVPVTVGGKWRQELTAPQYDDYGKQTNTVSSGWREVEYTADGIKYRQYRADGTLANSGTMNAETLSKLVARGMYKSVTNDTPATATEAKGE